MIRKVFLLILYIQSLFATNGLLEDVSVQLNWKYQFEFAGFIAAKEKGYYKDIGLNVDIKEFNNGMNVLEDLKSGKSTFLVYDLSLFRAGKTSLKLIANYFKRSALVFITKQNIITPYDLKGKIIMAEKNQLEFSTLNTLLKKFNIKEGDYNFKQHTYSPKDFINGKIDAMSAYLSNELYYIEKSKIPYNIIDPQTYGIFGSGVNLFTTTDLTIKRPELIKKFVEATNKGWEYALKHKKEIVDIIYDKYSKRKDKDALTFEANQIDKLIMPNVYRIGEINTQLLQRNINELISDGLIKDKLFKAENIIYNIDANKKDTLVFSKEQKEYLARKEEINLCIDPDWMPYEAIKNGKYIGMTSEFMPLISKKLGIPIKLIATKDWKESLNYFKKRKCDMLSLVVPTTRKKEYANFTSAYISFPLVIATKNDKLFISEPNKIISQKRVGIVKGYAINELLKENNPENKIVDVNNVHEGLKKVASGEIFGYVGALPSVAYNLQYNYVGELKISGKFDQTLNLSAGVRNDDPILLELLQEAITSIDEKTRQKIINSYISVKVESNFDYKRLYKFGVVILLITIILLYMHFQLARHNKALKKNQKQLNLSNEELIKTKRELEQSIEDFQVMINSVTEGIFIFENNICIGANDIANKMLGYDSKDEIIGKHLSEFMPLEIYKSTFKYVEAMYEKPYESKAKKSDGTIIDVISKGTNTTINSKNVRISVLIDISETKQKEQLLFQQSKMAAMGQMLENIAHQWRQPLSLISSLATAVELKRELGISTPEDELKDLEKINETSQHLSETIEDFRNFFKSNKKKEDFSILKAVEKNRVLLEGMLKTNSIEFIYQTRVDATIHSYENEFTQALINIFYNSKDALEKIEKETRFIFVNINKDEKHITITIRDNAGGIDDKIIKNIFEPYFTTKHQSQGTGIGLYMTQMIIEKHMNGIINVKNSYFTYKGRSYKGAEFIIRLSL